MTLNFSNVKLIERVCKGDAEAMDFLANHWARYCHGIDDIIDGERRSAEEILSIFAMAIEIYSHPFYLRNLQALRQIARNVTSEYADTVAWEHSTQEWQKQWADHHRHCSSEMVVAVATIVGGYDHARAIIPELRAIAYHEHHDRNGKPT